jgi:hypothetical protein
MPERLRRARGRPSPRLVRIIRGDSFTIHAYQRPYALFAALMRPSLYEEQTAPLIRRLYATRSKYQHSRLSRAQPQTLSLTRNCKSVCSSEALVVWHLVFLFDSNIAFGS